MDLLILILLAIVLIAIPYVVVPLLLAFVLGLFGIDIGFFGAFAITFLFFVITGCFKGNVEVSNGK